MSRTAAGLLECNMPLATREVQARRTNAAALLASIRPGPRADGHHGVGRDAALLRLPVPLARGLDGFGGPDLALRLGIAPSYPPTLGALASVRERLKIRDGRWSGAEVWCATQPPRPGIRWSPRRSATIVRLLERY